MFYLFSKSCAQLFHNILNIVILSLNTPNTHTLMKNFNNYLIFSLKLGEIFVKAAIKQLKLPDEPFIQILSVELKKI
jgi:hypothetical protein